MATSIVIDDTFGATLLGVFLTTFAYGVATIQVYRYWGTYRHDSRFTQFYVLSLWLLDTIKVICICHMQYYYTITNYGNFLALLSTTWSLNLALCMTAVVTSMVQSFLARRTWNFARRVRSTRIPPLAVQSLGVVIAMVSLAQLAFGMTSTAFAWKVKHFVKAAQYRWLGTSWLGSAAICDILLVVSLSTVLLTQRTGFKRTDMLINRIILFTVNTGLLTCVVATADLILFCTMLNLIHFIPNFLLGTLYIITLLATLHTGSDSGSLSPNSGECRTPSRTDVNRDTPGDIPLSYCTRSDTQNPAVSTSRRSELVQVQIDREICVQGYRFQLADGASQNSVDPEDVKCFDVSTKSHILV